MATQQQTRATRTRQQKPTTACVVQPERRGRREPGFVSINDTRYLYRTIAGRTVGVRQVVRIHNQANGEQYDVSLLSNGHIDCTCGDFTFRKANAAQDRHRCQQSDGLCKHGRGLRMVGILNDTTRAKATTDAKPTVDEVVEELRAGEANGGDMAVMLARVGESFGPAFRARVEARLHPAPAACCISCGGEIPDGDRAQDGDLCDRCDVSFVSVGAECPACGAWESVDVLAGCGGVCGTCRGILNGEDN